MASGPRRVGSFATGALLAGAWVLGCPARAWSDEGSTLTYVAVEGCPDADSFRDLVAARLGHDPFTASGRRAVSVEIAHDHGHLVGRAKITEEAGAAPGERALSGEPSQCDALASALAASVAIALDPSQGGAPPATAAPSPRPEPAAAREAPAERAPPAAPEPPRARVTGFGRAAVVSSVAATPGPSLGAEIGVGARAGAVSVEAFGRAETTLAAVRVGSGDRLEAAMFTGGLLPCAHHGGLFGCLAGRVGVMQGRAPDVADPRLGSSVFAALTVRLGYAWQLAPAFAVRGALEGGVPLVRTSLLVDHASVWTAPPVVAGLEIALVVSP